MTLVPIIYTSLLIFTCFLFFVIVVSYISYKAKSKERSLKLQQNPAYNEYQLAFQPAFVNKSYAMNEIPARIIPPIQLDTHKTQQVKRENQIEENSILQQVQKNEFNRQTKYASKESPKMEQRNLEAKNNRDTRYSQNHRSSTTRIEVINNSEAFRSNYTSKENPTRYYRTTSVKKEANILDYYSDRSDPELVVISANQIRNAV